MANFNRKAAIALAERQLAGRTKLLVSARKRAHSSGTVTREEAELIHLREDQVQEARTRMIYHRAKLAAERTLGQKALAEMEKLVGIMEEGGNNRGRRVTEIIRANGGTGPEPWCGDTVAYAYRKAGSKVVQRAWAAVKYLGFLTGQRIVKDPLPGDIVTYDFDHTGVFKRWINRKRGIFEAIEGNTGASGAVSDGDGGDGVYVKRRNINQVARFVRVTR